MAGKLCHFEIPSKEPDKAGEFYGNVFGWKIDAASFPGYHMIEASEPPNGGIEKREPFSPGIMIYIEVDDVTATLNKVKAAGGNIVKEKTEIPDTGHFGILNDPDGNVLGVFQGK